MKTENPDDVCIDRPIDEIWAQLVENLTGKLGMPAHQSLILPSQLVEIGKNHALLVVNNQFVQNGIERHKAIIQSALIEIIGRQVILRSAIDPSRINKANYTPSIGSITVIPERESRSKNQVYATASVNPEQRLAKSNLNPKHVFDSFVVGSSNRFSHAAALAVADKPGEAYNPLFLYGGVGLGKTHLLHAIGNALLQRSPNMVVRYMSCEKFTNDVINSIRDGRMNDFRSRYREINLLLMDDIQFIEGKESTQEEFFHTFNHLRDNGKQIVLTSDRPPKGLSRLEDRLRSRFEWGLITDIQAPDFEMRQAILRKKAEQEKMSVTDEVLEYIAKSFTSNIRELEGALTRANAFATLTGSGLSLGSISEILHPGGQKKKDRPPLTIEKLIETVSSYYHIEAADIKSSKRSQDLTVPRHVAMYLAHELMSMSFPRIGAAFGNRKHTSALYACDKIKEAIPEDPAIAEAVREITRQLDV